MYGHSEVVKELLHHTANFDVKSNFGLIPLAFGILLNFFLFKLMTLDNLILSFKV